MRSVCPRYFRGLDNMYFIIFILHAILLIVLLYLYLRFYRFRKTIEAHIRRFHGKGIIDSVSSGTEEGIERNLSEIEKKVNEFREVIDENRKLKETAGKITKELSETKEHLTNKISELHTLFEISASISLLTESGNLYKSIPESMKRYLGIEEVAIFIFDEEKEGLASVSHSDGLKSIFEDHVIKINEGVVGRVYSTGESIYIPDITQTSEQIHLRRQPRDIRSVIAVPLKKRDRSIGVFYISHKDENAFDPETLGTVKTLVRTISIAIENTELYQYAKMLAERDSLTLLYNHGTFHSRLEYELERAGRYRRNLTVIMLDIDAFKLVNDNFGHVTGDKILKMVAGVINAHTRKTDIAARYGGDEFAILLPETDHDAALQIAKRICFGLKNLKVDTGKGGDISVTASFGIASCKHDSSNRQNIVDIADSLMYTAKDTGYGEIVTKVI
jgi:diguanylate cyclase (GGDEF)-like protein